MLRGIPRLFIRLSVLGVFAFFLYSALNAQTGGTGSSARPRLNVVLIGDIASLRSSLAAVINSTLWNADGQRVSGASFYVGVETEGDLGPVAEALQCAGLLAANSQRISTSRAISLIHSKFQAPVLLTMRTLSSRLDVDLLSDLEKDAMKGLHERKDLDRLTSNSNFARLFIPILFPELRESVAVYLDLDTLVLEDLSDAVGVFTERIAVARQKKEPEPCIATAVRPPRKVFQPLVDQIDPGVIKIAARPHSRDQSLAALISIEAAEAVLSTWPVWKNKRDELDDALADVFILQGLASNNGVLLANFAAWDLSVPSKASKKLDAAGAMTAALAARLPVLNLAFYWAGEHAKLVSACPENQSCGLSPLAGTQSLGYAIFFLSTIFATASPRVPSSARDISTLPGSVVGRTYFLAPKWNVCNVGKREFLEPPVLPYSNGTHSFVADFTEGEAQALRQARLQEFKSAAVLHWAGAKAEEKPQSPGSVMHEVWREYAGLGRKGCK